VEAGSGRKPLAFKAVTVAAAVMVAALLLATPSAQTFIKDVVRSPFEPRYPEEVTYSMERRLTVTAVGGEVSSYTFDISEPKDIVESGQVVQKVNSVTYSPEVMDRSIRYGQDWVTWSGEAIPGGSSVTCTVVYDITVRTHIWDIDEDDSLHVQDVPESLKDAYLRDEWLMNMTSPAVAAQAEEIVGDETNVYIILKEIYEWMRENISYSTYHGSEPRSSEQMLRTMAGDCDDQSILFASLARAAGVPAWLQLGALYVQAEDRWGGHAWLQAYIPLKEGDGENVTIDLVNDDFLVRQPNRFADFTDDGDARHLTDYYYTFSSTFDRRTGTPLYTEEYVRLNYEESYRKVSRGAVYDLAPEIILPGTAPRPLRI